MPYEVEETGELSRRANITVPAEEFQKDVNKQLRKLSKRVKIRGFRKGKIPMSVMRKRYGDAVTEDVTEDIVRRYLDEVLEDKPVVHLSQPEVTSRPDVDEALTFTVEFELMPEIDPIGYLGVEVEKPEIEVGSEEIDEELERMREEFATYEPIELRNTIKEGDTVTFDFRALGDEEALENFQGEEAQVDIGSGESLPGIEEALEGADFGATVTATVEPPEDFHMEELAGKPFELEIDVKSVKKRRLPPLDDDFARDTGEGETLLELRQVIREQLEEDKDHEASHFAEENLLDRLLESHDFELPPNFVEEQIDQAVQQRLQGLAQQGLDPSQLDIDLSGFREAIREDKVSSLKAEFLLSAIADKEGIDIDEEDLMHYFEHQARHMGVGPAELMQYMQQDQNRIRQAVGSARLEKTVDHLLDEATIKEISREEYEKRLEEEQARRSEERAKHAARVGEQLKEESEAQAEEPSAEESGAEESGAEASETEEAAESGGGFDASAAREALQALTVPELKDLCRDNDLKVGGRKAEIIDRLVDHEISA